MRVLLVEDDVGIAEPLMEGLARQGFDVEWVTTGVQALAAAPAELVLLDLGLPDADGFSVCHALRARGSVPILVISARDAEVDRVVGLELGADDYLVKPFGFRELVARMRAVLRRSAVPPGTESVPPGTEPFPVTIHGRLSVDRRARRVAVDGEEIALTPKEFDLLALLAEDPGAVVSRQQILEEVWDPHWYGPTKTLDVHVASLRKKLGRPELVETVRRVGFRLGDSTPANPAPGQNA